MSAKRAYFGDLRLWLYGRGYVESMRSRTEVVHDGIDREEALVVSSNPNFESMVDVDTVFAAGPGFTQDEYRSTVAAMLDALRARAGMADAGHPLVWTSDVLSAASVLSSGATAPYATTGPHGLIVGDRVLIRALGLGNYTLAQVLTTPTTTSFTAGDLAVGAAYVPAAGMNAIRVDRAWLDCSFREFLPLARGTAAEAGAGGDYFAPTATYRFRVPSREGVYTRATVDLDLGSP